MAKDNNQKIKLVKLVEILRQETSQEAPLTTAALVQRLKDIGISSERRTLSMDIDMLVENGYDIQSRRIGHEKAYFVTGAERSFSLAEVRELMDAVQAATFLTREETHLLLDKVSSLAGLNRDKLLGNCLVTFRKPKKANEEVPANITVIQEAITRQKKVSFLYFDLNETQGRVYRRGKQRFEAEPSVLLYEADRYYLFCFNSKYDGPSLYRLDRMEDVRVEDEAVRVTPPAQGVDVAAEAQEMYRRYLGPSCLATLRFSRSLIGELFDRFGEVQMEPDSMGEFLRAVVEIQVCPSFWGWIMQFPGQIQILDPPPLVDEFRQWVSRQLDGYAPNA